LEDLFTEELMGAALPPQKLDFHKYLNFVQISAWVIGQTKRLRESELLVLTFLVVQIGELTGKLHSDSLTDLYHSLEILQPSCLKSFGEYWRLRMD